MSLSRQFAPRALRGRTPKLYCHIPTNAVSNHIDTIVHHKSGTSCTHILLDQARRLGGSSRDEPRWQPITAHGSSSTRGASSVTGRQKRCYAIRSHNIRSDSQLGTSGFAMADDFWFGLLCGRNDALVHPAIRPGPNRYHFQSQPATK